MKKDPRVFILHILECIELVEMYTKGKTKGDLLDSIPLQDMVTRRLEIIGEAVKKSADDFPRKV